MSDHEARDMRDIPTINEIKAGRLWNRCIDLLAEPPKYPDEDSVHPVQLIHRALDEAQGTWIDRRKRLPEDGERVLACVRRPGSFTKGGMQRQFILTKWGQRWVKDDDVFTDQEVTHWMPIPEEPS